MQQGAGGFVFAEATLSLLIERTMTSYWDGFVLMSISQVPHAFHYSCLLTGRFCLLLTVCKSSATYLYLKAMFSQRTCL